MSGKESDKKPAVTNGWINIIGADGLLIRRVPLSDGENPKEVNFNHLREIVDRDLKPETPNVSDWVID